MTITLPFLPAAFPQSNSRLAVGLALSLLVHVLLMANVRPAANTYSPPRPFQVEIRQPESRPQQAAAVTGETGFPAAVPAAPLAASRPHPEPGTPNTAPVATTGIELQHFPDNYLTSREVDVRAVPVNDVDLVYPQLAYQRRVKGRVILRLLINERGGLDQVSVLESEPRGLFEEAALSATWALQFSPARKGGRSVKSRQDIEVTFDPYESINIP